jgi:hypothetical protein
VTKYNVISQMESWSRKGSVIEKNR